tara:strand:- start:5553 stop:5999 length:447 start_codon:yes stop_codon:yes gene_type:complete
MRQLRQYIRQILLEADCWDGYSPGAQSGVKTKESPTTPGKRVNNCEKIKEDESEAPEDLLIDEADTPDKDKMKCNKPRYIRKGETGHGKQQKVVKACKDGKEKLVKFGDANMRNNSDKPKNRANFRSRHSCDTKKDNMTAGYWSCKDW